MPCGSERTIAFFWRPLKPSNGYAGDCGTADDVAALKGWRNDVFGKDAIALRKGDLAIALDGGEAVVVELED